MLNVIQAVICTLVNERPIRRGDYDNIDVDDS